MKRFLLLLIPFSLFAKPNGNRDFEVWNCDRITIPLSKKVHFSGNAEFRYGNHRKKLYYKQYQGGFHFYDSAHTHFHLAYRRVYNRVQEKWIAEHDPLIDLTVQVRNRSAFFLSNRQRVQYRILGEKLGGKNRWLYRNRTEFTPSYRLYKHPIIPFLADEFFWQEGRGIDQNRLEAGLKIPYHQRTHLNLSYIWRLLKDPQNNWLYQNVMRVDFTLHF
ncbi:MAG: DUF2490 domain-containing protein [Simkaniaceae bacterium]|nr:DUF2490 domain-containing protein [Simkaniaceae bacterium]